MPATKKNQGNTSGIFSIACKGICIHLVTVKLTEWNRGETAWLVKIERSATEGWRGPSPLRPAHVLATSIAVRNQRKSASQATSTVNHPPETLHPSLSSAYLSASQLPNLDVQYLHTMVFTEYTCAYAQNAFFRWCLSVAFPGYLHTAVFTEYTCVYAQNAFSVGVCQSLSQPGCTV
ncbi:unnamed protein product [Ectocarpus fasciculatus]